MNAKINGTYYAHELVRGYKLARDYHLGGWNLLNEACGNPNWQEFVEDEQGQPSPLNWSWQKYSQRAADVLKAYGGCAQILKLYQQQMSYKQRP